ncbi:MAG: PKD domain-containing protein [Ferruginibacter sp.]
MASESNTNVYINGAFVANLNASDIYPANYSIYLPVLPSGQPTNISADKPISVTQYLQSNACAGAPGGSQGDPDMVILNPIEQNIKDITVFSSSTQAITQRFVNVLIKTNATGSFRINGGLPTTTWQPSVNLPGYSYLQGEPFPGTGSYRLVADSGFNAIAYGYGANESYAYSAGTNVIDLTQQLEISTQYGIESTPSVCVGTPFKFKVYFPVLQVPPAPFPYFDSVRWSCTSPAVSPNNFPITTTTVPDSTNIRNGKSVNWYSLPGFYNFTTPGTYTVTVTTYKSTTEGCGSEQDFDFQVVVSNPPAPSFTATQPGCYLEPVQFTETTPQIPKATYMWFWDFGDGSPYVFTKNPQHIYAAPGTYTARYSAVTTPGCISDTVSVQVVVPDVPLATISTGTAVCLNAPSPTITFTGSEGRSPYEFTYTINGTPQPPVVSNAAGIYTITGIPTNAAGIFTYNLTGVKNVGSTICTKVITGQLAAITVNPLPVAQIVGGAIACLNGPSPTITFTGSGGTAPYTFAYTINGIPQTPIVSNAAGVATIAAPTTAAGAFAYSVTLITDNSTTLCSQAFNNVNTTVTINALPAAVISGSATAVCLNATSPTITFTGSAGTAPYTFNYTLNGAPQAPVVSNAAGVYTITVPTNIAGPFAYVLTSVQEGSANACIQPAVTGQSATITINPIPTAIIAGATTVCLNATSPTVTFTGSGGTAPYTFAYTINGIPQAPAVSNIAGIATIPAATTVAGPFVYAITTVTDASSTLCSQTLNNVNTTINISPLPTAAISGAATVCINAASPTITFTGAGGIAPYIFTYTINGAPQAPVVSNAAGVYTIAVPTATAGPFNYALVSVQESGPNTCIQPNLTGQSAIITVNALPTAVIGAATNTVCLNATSPSITFTGSGGTAPYTFIYTLNGVPQPPVVSNAGGTYTITVPTTITGPFTYVLTSVQEGSANACIQPNVTGQSATVTVNPLPTAVIAGATTVCLNATSPTVTFTGSGSTAPYTFAYTINGVPQAPAVSNLAGIATVTAPTTIAGPFVYSITSVTDASATSCSKPLTNVTTTINVSPLPTAAIAGATAVCLNAPSPTIIFTGSGGAAPYTFTYTINGVPQAPVVSNAAGTYSIAVPTATAGPFNYALVSVQESGPNACIRPNISGQSATVTVNPLPVASIATATTDVCLNAASPSITFTGTGGTAPYTFNYTINGAPQAPLISNGAGIALLPVSTTTANTFVYALTSVSDGTATACAQNQNGTATVIVHPLPTALISGNIEVCQNATSPGVTFTGANGTAPYTFTYSVNGGADQTVTTAVGNSVTVLQSTATAGTYTYLLKSVNESSATGCSQLQNGTVAVKVNPLPTAAISGSKLICINTASPDVTFTGANGTTPYTFRYRINGGALQTITTTGTNTSVTVPVATNAAGVFNYTLEDVRDGSTTACLQSQTGNATITISNVFPNPAFAFSDPVCLPNALVQFQNQTTIADGSAMTYLWNFGDGSATSTAFQPSHTYSSVGPFNVLLQATSNAGCVTTIPIAVNSIHAQPKAAFSISKPAGVCIGDDVVLTDLTDAKDGVVAQWNWDLGDGTTVTTNPITYKYGSAKTYNITLYTVNSFGCNSDTITQSFTVHPYPVVDAGPDGIVLEGGSYTLQPSVTGNDLQYLWSPSTYLNSTTIATPTANIMLNDITYKLVVTGRGGCEAAPDYVFIKVLKAPQIPNTFTPNGDGINELWLIDYLDTYPNCKVQVFTRTGKLVFESKGYKTPWNGKFNGKPLPFDTYYYIIEPENGRKPMTGYVTIVK